ncbi:MAG TPA: efflux RND transporter periplasmic adaptor subunit [Candidatus Aminicenantes bacterium]|nr:efflux RND transporter periplasmic adaptor subunit [Candidatus Aminicenantes bacterium]
MKKVIGWGATGALVIVALIFLFVGGKKDGQGITLVKVKRGDIAERAMAVGTIEPEKEIKVKSTMSGIVRTVHFKVGDKVRSGDPLFLISPNPTPLEYVETQRNMELTRVTLDQLQNDRERKAKLFAARMISSSEMEQIESQLRETELRHRIAKERFQLLEKGRIQVANKSIDSVVKSPIDGIVLQQSVFEGDPVVPLTTYQPGTELCSLADMGKLLFKGTVDEIDVGKLEAGMAVEIQIGALTETKISGQLLRIHPKARKDGNATLFDIEILITSTGDKTLRAGYSATAYLTVREKKGVLVLPERLVTFADGKKTVEIQSGEEIVPREITTGLSDGLNVEVLTGLKENESVVERPPREIQ